MVIDSTERLGGGDSGFIDIIKILRILILLYAN